MFPNNRIYYYFNVKSITQNIRLRYFHKYWLLYVLPSFAAQQNLINRADQIMTKNIKVLLKSAKRTNNIRIKLA